MSSEDEPQGGSIFLEKKVKHVSYNAVITAIECYVHFVGKHLLCMLVKKKMDSAVYIVFVYQDYLMHRRTRRFS